MTEMPEKNSESFNPHIRDIVPSFSSIWVKSSVVHNCLLPLRLNLFLDTEVFFSFVAIINKMAFLISGTEFSISLSNISLSFTSHNFDRFI